LGWILALTDTKDTKAAVEQNFLSFFESKIQIAATTTDTKNIRLTK